MWLGILKNEFPFYDNSFCDKATEALVHMLGLWTLASNHLLKHIEQIVRIVLEKGDT